MGPQRVHNVTRRAFRCLEVADVAWAAIHRKEVPGGWYTWDACVVIASVGVQPWYSDGIGGWHRRQPAEPLLIPVILFKSPLLGPLWALGTWPGWVSNACRRTPTTTLSSHHLYIFQTKPLKRLTTTWTMIIIIMGVGGAAHSFDVRGFKFDAGPSFFLGLTGERGTSPNPLKQVLDAVGEKVECKQYDRVSSTRTALMAG